MKVRDLPLDERPREKLIKKGAACLTNEELLAVILGKGTRKEDVFSISRKLISQYGTISKYSTMKVQELMKMFDIPRVHALQVIAVMELGKRLFSEGDNIILNSPSKVYEFARDMAYLKKEVVRGLYLDTRGHLIHDEILFMGSLSETTVHPREVLKPAIVHSAFSFILLHNHPSGDPTPSKADMEFTEKIGKASEILDIKFLDHLIIGREGYESLMKR